jgi:glycosyltransferase involved in cell wall biosynthesis
MKITIISTFLGQKWAGGEISSFLLAENLNRKQNIFVITTKIKNEMPFKNYSLALTRFIPNLILLIGSGLLDKYMTKKIYNILKKEKPDIVHIQDSSMIVAGVSAAKRLDIPTVFTVRDYRFICNLAICLEKNKIKFGCDKKQYKKCLYESFEEAYDFGAISYLIFPWFYRQNNKLVDYFKKIDHYITVSDFVKRQVMKNGIDEEKIQTIKVQKEEWKPIKNDKKQKEIIIFSGGGLKKVKGFDFLIKSFSILVNKYPKAILRIAGEGSAKNKLMRLTRKLSIRSNVVFLGQINHDKMKQEYANSTFVISPSLWPEPLSRIIFEAFTMKRTVIATNVGGSSELVKHNKTGLLVKAGDIKEMADAMISLIKNYKLRKMMALNAFRLVNKECNKEIIYNKHIEVYNNVIKRTRKTRRRI